MARTKEKIELDTKILAYAKGEFEKAKKGEQSKCEAIRKTARKFGKARRIVLEVVFVKGLKQNLGTVRRQIQEGRAAE